MYNYSRVPIFAFRAAKVQEKKRTTKFFRPILPQYIGVCPVHTGRAASQKRDFRGVDYVNLNIKLLFEPFFLHDSIPLSIFAAKEE